MLFIPFGSGTPVTPRATIVYRPPGVPRAENDIVNVAPGANAPGLVQNACLAMILQRPPDAASIVIPAGNSI